MRGVRWKKGPSSKNGLDITGNKACNTRPVILNNNRPQKAKEQKLGGGESYSSPKNRDKVKEIFLGPFTNSLKIR